MTNNNGLTQSDGCWRVCVAREPCVGGVVSVSRRGRVECRLLKWSLSSPDLCVCGIVSTFFGRPLKSCQKTSLSRAHPRDKPYFEVEGEAAAAVCTSAVSEGYLAETGGVGWGVT